MKKIWMSILMNRSGVQGEEYKLLSIRKDIVEDSAEKGGTEEMKAMLRERIVVELFNNDMESFFDGMDLTEDKVDACINELAMGKDSNILCENFWWEEEDVIISLTDDEPEKKEKPTHVHRCRECGSTDVEQKWWVNPNTMEITSWCEEDEVWCNHCEDYCKYDVVPIETMEVFDGKLGIRFKYRDKVYEEVINPAMAESDPELENVWFYLLDSGDENVRMVLFGNYLMGDGDNDSLSTTQLLQVKVEDAAEDESYIDDIDII